MANEYGMLGLGAADEMDQRALDARRTRAMSYAQLTPQQQTSYLANNAAQMVGGGIGSLAGQGVGMLTGNDPRSTQDKMRSVQAEMQQALQGVDPGDIDKVYPTLIRILQQHGMMPEAMKAQEKYEELKLKKQDRSIKQGDLDRKTTKDAADKAAVTERLAIARSGTPQAKAEAIARLVDEMNAEPDARETLRLEAQMQMFGYKPDRTRDWQVTLIQGNKNEPARVLKYNRASGKYDVETLGGAKASTGPDTGLGIGENATRIGALADGSGPVMKGSKTGKLYVYEGGNPVPYNVANHGEWNHTQTEAEARAASLGGRLEKSDAQIESSKAMLGPTRAKMYFQLDGQPLKQSALQLTFSDDEKQYVAGVRQFLNANLRYDSGAAVPESEYPKYMDALIPFDGDNSDLRAQKRANRADTTRLIVRKTGGPTNAGTGDAEIDKMNNMSPAQRKAYLADKAGPIPPAGGQDMAAAARAEMARRAGR